MKRIKYIPGIISLIGLPILCMLYLHSHNYFRKTAVVITFRDLYIEGEEQDSHFMSFEKRLANEIHEETFVLSNDENQNKLELERFKQYATHFQLEKKKNRYSTFQISDAIQYQYLIELLDQLSIQKIPLYSLENNTMYFIPYYEFKDFIDSDYRIVDLTEKHKKSFFDILDSYKLLFYTIFALYFFICLGSLFELFKFRQNK